MKKTLALILAIVMALGCMSITAFATTVPSWSYDEETDTITINYEIPAGAEVGTKLPNQSDFLLGDDVNIAFIGFGWGMQDDDAPYIYNDVHWNNALGKTITSGNRYGYIIMISYKEKTVDHSNAKVILNGKTYTNLGNAGGEINYQPFLIADFGVLGADGSFSGGDFAETKSGNKSGNTEITAEITAADFGYEMVIPTATTLTEANHENVLLGTDGKVSIKDIKHPTDKVNVSYTVDLSNGNLTDGTTTINATYKYKQGDADFAAIDGTTKVTVYENKTVNDSFVNVTADKDQWDAAPVGTYNATVVFNFAQDVITTSGEVTYKVEGIHDGISNNLKFTDSNGTVCTGDDLVMAVAFSDLFGLPVGNGTAFYGLDGTSENYLTNFMCDDEREDSSWNGTYKWIESYFQKIQ